MQTFDVFFVLKLEQVVEQTVELLLIWDSIVLMWRHFVFQDIDSRCESSVSYTPPEIPQRPSSSVMETFRQERELESLHSEVSKRLQGDSPSHMQTESSPELEDNMVEHDDFEPLYQEIDDNHESKYEPKCSGPPQVRIERKVFPNPQLMSSSLISSTTGSEEMLDSQTSHTSSTGATSSPPQLRPLRDPSATSTPYARPKPKAKADPINVPAFLPLTRTQSPPAICPFAAASKNHTFSALATVPRRKKDNRLQAADLKPASHDHRLPGTKDDTRTIPYEHLRADATGRVRIPGMKPPTPPMRRLPSWVRTCNDIMWILNTFHSSQSAVIQCRAIITQSFFTKILMINTTQLAHEGEMGCLLWVKSLNLCSLSVTVVLNYIMIHVYCTTL